MTGIPLDEQGFVKWTLDRYREKDALLDRFYKTGNFSDTRHDEHLLANLRSMTFILFSYAFTAFLIYLGCKFLC